MNKLCNVFFKNNYDIFEQQNLPVHDQKILLETTFYLICCYFKPVQSKGVATAKSLNSAHEF